MNQNQVDEPERPQGEQEESLNRKFKIVAQSFSELFELLEQFAPTWYTEEHHKRALAANSVVEKSKGASA